MSIITVKYVTVIFLEFLVFWDCCTLLKGRHLTNVMALDGTNEYGLFVCFVEAKNNTPTVGHHINIFGSRTAHRHCPVAVIGRPPVRTLSRKPSIGNRFATRKLSLTTIRRIRRMYSEAPVYNNITRRAILTYVPL